MMTKGSNIPVEIMSPSRSAAGRPMRDARANVAGMKLKRQEKGVGLW